MGIYSLGFNLTAISLPCGRSVRVALHVCIRWDRVVDYRANIVRKSILRKFRTIESGILSSRHGTDGGGGEFVSFETILRKSFWCSYNALTDVRLSDDCVVYLKKKKSSEKTMKNIAASRMRVVRHRNSLNRFPQKGIYTRISCVFDRP